MEFNIIVVFIFGLTIGSFLNVLIDRLPKREDVFWGRSRCDFCKKRLRWFELIPLLSFLLQRGRCRRCKKKLSLQYPLIELVTAVGFLFLFQGQASQAHQDLALRGSWIVFSSLLVIFVADLKYQIIPDSMVVVGLIGVLLQGQAFEARQGLAFWYAAFGAAAFFLALLLLTRGRGIGLGDVKFGFLMGLLLGFPKIVIGLYIAFLTGAFVGVILIMTKKKLLKSKIAFGPFLVIGTVSTMVWGDRILGWWNTFI